MAKRCFCCLTSILLVVLIFVGILLGVSAWGFDKYAKPELGIGFWDTLGIVNGLYSTNEKKIVTNPFNETQEIHLFVENFKQQLTWPEDMPLTLDEILSGEVDWTQIDLSEFGNSIEDFRQSLKISMTDRQFAAILNKMLQEVTPENKSDEIDDLIDHFSVEQAIFSKEDNATKIKLTFRLNIREVLGAEEGGWYLKLLPKKTFIHFFAYPENLDKAGAVSINRFSAKQDASLYTILDTLLRESDGVDALLLEVNQMIAEVIAAISEYIATIEFVVG